MPSIRLTPLQPTSFDEWRDRVLTTPRDALVMEQHEQTSEGAGSFRTLSAALVGADGKETLASELRHLATVLSQLLSDPRGNPPVGIGQTSADIRTALAAGGAVPAAIDRCGVAIRKLKPGTASGDGDGAQSPSAVPDDVAFSVLLTLREPSRLLMNHGVVDISKALAEWFKGEAARSALERLAADDPDLAERFSHLQDPLPEGADDDAVQARRERLGELIALEYDVTRWQPGGGEDDATTSA